MTDEMSREEMKAFIANVNQMNRESGCPLEIAMDVLGGKWRMRCIGVIAAKDACRFGEIKRELPGITNTMLTKTLRDLEQIGLIRREQFNEIPPHVEYSLTKAGEELFPGIYEWTRWSVKYIEYLKAFQEGSV